MSDAQIYDFSQTGLPSNPRWAMAANVCFNWLNENMPFFKGEGILNFMRDQPVAAAKRLLQHVPDCSEEVVTLALIGPAKDMILNTRGGLDFMRDVFGERAAGLLLTLADTSHAVDTDMIADAERIFLVEGMSTMADQMIGRQSKDRHHQTRWTILRNLEQTFEGVKGKNPALDAAFVDAVKKSRESLEALDNKPPKAGPKPPGHG